jgi:hypothetical protein
MSNLNDFFGGNDDVAVDAEASEVLPRNARIVEGADISAPCFMCYRNDATEFTRSDDYDCLDVRCTRCNVEFRFKAPGLWRMLGLS